MTGFSFGGAWYLQSAVALQWANIIWPRLQAGRDPIPQNFQDQQQLPAITAGPNSNNNVLDFYDENGMYDVAKGALYDARKRGGWDVAVVPLSGVMSRDGMCGRGMDFTGQVLKAAAKNPGVAAAVLYTNTPGGTVDATRELADVVRDFPKPIIVQTPAAYSAGYFVASQAREIWLDPQSIAGVGSIGTIYVHMDDSEKLKMEGLKPELLVSEGSEDKVIYGGYAGMTPELRAEINSMLSASRREFVGYVRRGRAGKLANDSVLTGKSYRGNEAVNSGLVEGVMTLDQAIKRARKMA